jgi:hypothetical protein
MNSPDPIVVGIHGAPRSGTSWLGQLFNSSEHVAYRYQPFFSYAFRGRIEQHSSADVVHACMEELLDSSDDFVTQAPAARIARNLPQFDKQHVTHLVYKEVRFHDLTRTILRALPNARIIGMVRDPRAVLASWANAPREFKPDWAIAEEWQTASKKNSGKDENWYGYNRWKQLATEFLDLTHAYPERFRLVVYEDLRRNPHETVKALFEFCRISLRAQTAGFIDASTSLDDGVPYGVFRQRGNQPAGFLPDEISREIEKDLAGSPLADFLREDLR